MTTKLDGTCVSNLCYNQSPASGKFFTILWSFVFVSCGIFYVPQKSQEVFLGSWYVCLNVHDPFLCTSFADSLHRYGTMYCMLTCSLWKRKTLPQSNPKTNEMFILYVTLLQLHTSPPVLQCQSPRVSINNAVLRFRFGEKENQCTFVLHERAFSSVCLFSDSALGKRLQHKHFTATCARGHTFCTVDGEELDSTWD